MRVGIVVAAGTESGIDLLRSRKFHTPTLVIPRQRAINSFVPAPTRREAPTPIHRIATNASGS